jgi:hypothetical protein
MKKRFGNCSHGLSLNVNNEDCCLVCISPNNGDGQFLSQENIMASPIMKYFEYSHLPAHLQEISKLIGDLAKDMDNTLPDCAEKSAGLRKLLEAKDCLVRAKLG